LSWNSVSRRNDSKPAPGRLRTYQEREAAFRAVKPDFDAIVGIPRCRSRRRWPRLSAKATSARKLPTIWETNRQEAARIASLSPQRQAAELGKIEAA
jgi:hypothetical protein